MPPLPQARLSFATLMVVGEERVEVPAAKFRVSFRRYNSPGLLFYGLQGDPRIWRLAGKNLTWKPPAAESFVT